MFSPIPNVFNKKSTDEILCQLGCVAEILVVKAVVDIGDIGKCLLFGIS